MARRAHSVVVSSPSSVQLPTVPVEADVAVEEKKLLPATVRLLSKFEKINKKGYVSLAEFDKICLMVAGDSRRAIQKLLTCLYQRSMMNKDGDETKRLRMLSALYDSEKLDKYLELAE